MITIATTVISDNERFVLSALLEKVEFGHHTYFDCHSPSLSIRDANKDEIDFWDGGEYLINRFYPALKEMAATVDINDHYKIAKKYGLPQRDVDYYYELDIITYANVIIEMFDAAFELNFFKEVLK